MNSHFRGVRLFSRSKFANISGIQILVQPLSYKILQVSPSNNVKC